jgi:hypothetical protein
VRDHTRLLPTPVVSAPRKRRIQRERFGERNRRVERGLTGSCQTGKGV